MFCKNCGREQQNGELFCTNCGTQYESSPRTQQNNIYLNYTSKCPVCDTPMSIDDEYCPSCNRHLNYNCPSCRQDFTYGRLLNERGHCPHCGTRITELYNVPNYKYPYFEKGSQRNDESQDSSSRAWAGILVLCLVGFGIWYLFGDKISNVLGISQNNTTGSYEVAENLTSFLRVNGSAKFELSLQDGNYVYIDATLYEDGTSVLEYKTRNNDRFELEEGYVLKKYNGNWTYTRKKGSLHNVKYDYHFICLDISDYDEAYLIREDGNVYRYSSTTTYDNTNRVVGNAVRK